MSMISSRPRHFSSYSFSFSSSNEYRRSRGGWTSTITRRSGAIALFLAMIFTASAQEPLVRSSLEKQEDTWVGQRITCIVELLAPGFFSGTASFDLPDPPGMMMIPPVSSPTVGSEDIGGVSYTVQHYELAVFSRRAGEQTVPAFPIRFSYKRQPLDKDSVAASGMTEPLHFTAKLPPGAEKLGSIISARDLKVVETWKPEPGKAKAGDAFTRTITFSAPDVPAMAFPQFPAGKIDGLGIYPKAAEVLDHSDRGELTGKRRDVITYLCQRAGQFTIPATKLTWFDLDAEKLQTIDFPARTLDVTSNPALASGTPAAESGKVPWMRFVWSVTGMFALVLLLFVAKKLQVKQAVMRIAVLFRPIHLPPLNPPQIDVLSHMNLEHRGGK